MAARKPKVGDTVQHHGRAHTIVDFPQQAVMKKGKAVAVTRCRFENDRFLVNVDVRDLKWLESDAAWYLPGRLLSRDERCVYEAAVGSWPKAENHVIARQLLDAVDLAEVDKDRLREVVRRMKARALAEAGITKPDGTFDNKAFGAYVDLVLDHVQQLRAERS